MQRESWPSIPREQQHLRRLRQAVPMTMGELAEAANCSKGYLRRCETTTQQPSAELATRLAQILSVKLDCTVDPAEFTDTLAARNPVAA